MKLIPASITAVGGMPASKSMPTNLSRAAGGGNGGLSVGFGRSAMTTLSPDAARRAVDMARNKSLRKIKAPNRFNVLLVGAQGTGKTSFARTLLETIDLGLCGRAVRDGKCFERKSVCVERGVLTDAFLFGCA